MAKHIGIVAVSFEGAALCYRVILQEAINVMGCFDHPEVSLHNHSLQHYMDFIEKNEWDGVASLMISSTDKLAAAGADFAVCPDNTVHRVFEKVVRKSPIPMLSIVDVVSEECRAKGYRKVGVLGTKYTMQGPMYRDALSKRGIEMEVPSLKDQRRVNEIIFSELVPEGIANKAIEELLGIIEKLKKLECDAVILGCTELPLVINSENSVLPVVDSTRLLAHRALERSLGKALNREF